MRLVNPLSFPMFSATLSAPFSPNLLRLKIVLLGGAKWIDEIIINVFAPKKSIKRFEEIINT